MNSRTRKKRKLDLAFQEIADFCYYLFPKGMAAQLMSSFRHMAGHKGLPFLVGYLRGFRQILLTTDVESWKSLRVRRTRKVLLRGLLVIQGRSDRHLREHTFFKFLKTVSLFRANIDRNAYICERDRLTNKPVFNQIMFENLTAELPKISIPERREPYNCLTGHKTWVGYKTYTGSKVTLQALSMSGQFIAQLLEEFPSLFSFLNATPNAITSALFSSDENVAGRAVLINKDGGLKKRLIFIPHCAIQIALTPLYSALRKIAKTLPGLYNFDVAAGVQWVSAQHSVLYSIDLTSATDWFPVEWQVDILSQMLGSAYEEDLKLLLRVSKMRWLTPHKGVEITLSVGQPMGLLASFLAFSISLYQVVRCVTHRDNFAILGDDIITTDIEVYIALISLGLLISEHKNVIGRNAEWGGTAFLDGIPQYDHRIKLSTDVLSIIEHRTWPVAVKKLSRMFSPRNLAKIKFIASLPPPVGCGLNPKVAQQLSPQAIEDLYFNEESPFLEAPKQPPLMGLRMQKLDRLRAIPMVAQQQEAGVPEEEQVLPNGKRVIDLVSFFKTDMTGVATLSSRLAEASTQEESLLSAYKLPTERERAHVLLTNIGLCHEDTPKYPIESSEHMTDKRVFPSWKRLSAYLENNTNLPMFINKQRSKPAMAEVYTTVITWDHMEIDKSSCLGDFSDNWPEQVELASTRALRGFDPSELATGRYKVAVKWEGIPLPNGLPQVTGIISHVIVS